MSDNPQTPPEPQKRVSLVWLTALRIVTFRDTTDKKDARSEKNKLSSDAVSKKLNVVFVFELS